MDQQMRGMLLGILLFMFQCAYCHMEEIGCQLHITYIHCKGSQKPVLPSVDISNVETIFFTSCNMSLLTYEDFAALPQVINIEIRSSNLSFPTNKGLFSKVKDLKYLRVENCDVGEEVEKLFPENESLERLSLPKNRITSISRQLLRNLTSLQELDLSGNGASHLEDGAFDELKELRVLDLRDNALNGGSVGVVALTPNRCSVCRLPGVSDGCYKTDVAKCVSGRPVDRLWWRSSGLTLRLEGNPVCNESSASVETESSPELYYGDMECDAEEECSKQESRDLFLKEACGKRHPNSSDAANEQRYPIEAEIKMFVLYTIGVVIFGILTGGVSMFFISKHRQKKSVKNIAPCQRKSEEGTSEQYNENIVFHATSQDETTTVEFLGENSRLLFIEDTKSHSPRNEVQECRFNVRRLHSIDECEVNYDTIGSISPMSIECFNPSDCTSHEGSPLHVASLEGDWEKLNELLEKGEDPKKKTCRLESPLWFGILGGHQKVVQVLCEKAREEVQSRNLNGDTPLHIGVHEENETIVKLLLEYNALRVAQNVKGETPLHIAVYRKNTEIIKLLVDGCDCINQPNIQGNTPLFLAVRMGHVKIVHLLIEKGADPNVENVRGERPIHIACWHGRGKIVQILFNKGSDFNVKDRYGNTELHVACRRGYFNIVKALLKRGSQINAVNRKGHTPLHRAVKGNHFKLVELLIEEGADVSVQSSEGETPLDEAKRLRNQECVDVLMKEKKSKNDNDHKKPNYSSSFSPGGEQIPPRGAP